MTAKRLVLDFAMARTRLQLEADRRAATLRRTVAEDMRRLREDAGLNRVAVAREAGVHPSVLSRMEAGLLAPSFETYARICAALGAELSMRVYPQSGPAIRDRHQVRMAAVLLGRLSARWQVSPEVAVRRPVRGWVDLALHDERARTLVAGELESGLQRIEQLLRWSAEKAAALPSSAQWSRWARDGPGPAISRLLVVRWTRANRDAAEAARRLLREAYPADPRDAIDALTGDATWPGPAFLWLRTDPGNPGLMERAL